MVIVAGERLELLAQGKGLDLHGPACESKGASSPGVATGCRKGPVKP
jgi:hypothetical protein